MVNPVLVEVSRGGRVESAHRGAIVIAGPGDTTVWSLGDGDRPVFPRSAIKALQALPLIESGAADRFGFTPAELALACASHNGEPGHVATARAMLGKLGLDETALACGPHRSILEAEAVAMIERGDSLGPGHNNCSGKHAGMLALARALDAPTAGYERPNHPVQAAVRAVLADMTGVAVDAAEAGIDGCSVPTYPIPLTALARAFQRFATGEALPDKRAEACRRLRAACAAHPDMVAGRDRFCTDVMRRFGARVFVKTGAEGVFCAGFPEQGLGVALKIDDGATRASEAAMAALIARVLALGGEDASFLARWRDRPILNWTGTETGRITSGDWGDAWPR